MQCSTYYHLRDQFIPSGKDVCVNQGGSRSGKTFSTLQFLIETAIKAHVAKLKGRKISICRKTMPALRGSAMEDFYEILGKADLYDESCHDKTNSIYHLYETTFEFFSLDMPTKVRGRKRDILFINEANELSLEDWRQLLLRTTDKIILDYNPDDEFHWIYDHVLTRDDAVTFITTYKDNPFLPLRQVKEIESYKLLDENYWKVYGLGQRGLSGATIFTNWTQVDEIPQGGNRAYGLDFGFNNPSSLMLCVDYDKVLYLDEQLYKSHLTNTDLITELKLLNIGRTPIYCDNAEPDRIEEIRRAGFNAIPAKKEVKVGLDKMKSVPIKVTKRSLNFLKEIKSYKYKVDQEGKPIADEPVKINDHACDAARYGSYDLIVDRKLTFRVAKMV